MPQHFSSSPLVSGLSHPGKQPVTSMLSQCLLGAVGTVVALVPWSWQPPTPCWICFSHPLVPCWVGTAGFKQSVPPLATVASLELRNLHRPMLGASLGHSGTLFPKKNLLPLPWCSLILLAERCLMTEVSIAQKLVQNSCYPVLYWNNI